MGLLLSFFRYIWVFFFCILMVTPKTPLSHTASLTQKSSIASFSTPIMREKSY